MNRARKDHPLRVPASGCPCRGTACAAALASIRSRRSSARARPAACALLSAVHPSFAQFLSARHCRECVPAAALERQDFVPAPERMERSKAPVPSTLLPVVCQTPAFQTLALPVILNSGLSQGLRDCGYRSFQFASIPLLSFTFQKREIQ